MSERSDRNSLPQVCLIVVTEVGRTPGEPIAASVRYHARLPGPVPAGTNTASVEPLSAIGDGVGPFAHNGKDVGLGERAKVVEDLA